MNNYANKSDNIKEIHKLLETYYFLKQTQEEIENLNREIMTNEIDWYKSFQQTQSWTG